MGKRGRLEIYMDVLKAVRDEHKPTKIMYLTNLSWCPLQEIFRRLQENGLIRVEKKGRSLYYLTEKGNNVLSYFSHLERALSIAA